MPTANASQPHNELTYLRLGTTRGISYEVTVRQSDRERVTKILWAYCSKNVSTETIRETLRLRCWNLAWKVREI